jgi:chromosome segregation ATPase
MASERLDMAMKNFQHMNQMVERYTRLCRAYVKLSERFHQLDVEHMKLKGQMVPLLKVAQTYKSGLQNLEAEKASLEVLLQQQTQQYQSDLQNLTKTYEEKLQFLEQRVEELKPLEALMSSEAFHHLVEAEEQIELDEATFQEMDEDTSPDLTAEEKALIEAFRENPEAFLPAVANGHQTLSTPGHDADSESLWTPALGERPMVEQVD